MSVFEQNKEVIVEEIKSIIESGIFHSIPTVHEYVQNHQEIKEALLQQYIQKTAPELGGCNFREALKQLGVDEATAIMQATLNDTIIIGDDHQLYSNCANDLLSTNKDYYVKSELVLKANRKGLCRGYRLSTSKTVNMENGVGFVRTQKKFNIGMYWVYPIVRVYIEYILMYGKTYGIKIQTQDCTAEFTFNDIIKKRFGTDVGVWDCLHDRLTSFDEIFQVDKVLSTENNGIIGVVNKTGRIKKIDMLQEMHIQPCLVEDLFGYYGGKQATTIEALAFLNRARAKGILWDYYKTADSIFEKDILNHLKRDKIYNKIVAKYTISEDINPNKAPIYLEKGTVAILLPENEADFYTVKGKSKGEIATLREDAEQAIEEDSGEIINAIASYQMGGYDLEMLFPFLRKDLIEVWSLTDKNKNILIPIQKIKGCWTAC